ncbi:MAG: hypothetical protein WAU45_01845 [Blastocatellia bacterium]
MSDTIATTALTCVRPTGDRIDVVVEIGVPYRAEDGEWACALSLGALELGMPHVKGDDSLQALCLALSLARQLLTYFAEDGGRILIAGTESEFPMDSYFSWTTNAKTDR